MDPQNYLIAWGIYLVAGVIFSILSWRVLHRYCWRELALVLECWLLALMFVPAQVISDPPTWAPALMVFVMDTLTIDSTAGIGALTNLVLGLGLGLVVAILLGLVLRITRQRRNRVPL